MTANLRIQFSDGRQEDRTFAPGKYQVGREAGDIVLADPNTSARHAEIEVRADAVQIVDLGSSNGTYDASGQRLSSPSLLHPGQPIKLGTSSITLLAGPSAAAGRTVAMPQYAEPVQPASPAAPAAPAANAPSVQTSAEVAALLKQGLGTLATRMGKLPLAATVVLWVAWFGLPAIQLMLPTFTLWQVVSYDPALAFAGGPGFFSLLGILALAAPPLAHQFRHRSAYWLYAAPLAFLGLVALRFLWMYVGSGGMSEFAVKMMFQALEVKYGFFLVLAASIVLAVHAFKTHAVVDPQGVARAQERLQELGGVALRQSGRAAAAATRELGGVMSTPRGKIAVAGGVAAVVLAVAASAFLLKPKNPLARQQALMDEYAAVFKDNQGDCGAMGEALSDFVSDKQSEFAAIAKEIGALSFEERMAYAQEVGSKSSGSMLEMASFGLQCGADPKFLAAMQEMSSKRMTFR